MTSVQTLSAEEARKSYFIGFALAVILTIIPFALVAAHVFSRSTVLMVILVTAVLQVLVHLRFFLHLGMSKDMQLNTLATVFAFVLLALMVGGSGWIMLDLHRRM